MSDSDGIRAEAAVLFQSSLTDAQRRVMSGSIREITISAIAIGIAWERNRAASETYPAFRQAPPPNTKGEG